MEAVEAVWGQTSHKWLVWHKFPLLRNPLKNIQKLWSTQVFKLCQILMVEPVHIFAFFKVHLWQHVHFVLLHFYLKLTWFVRICHLSENFRQSNLTRIFCPIAGKWQESVGTSVSCSKFGTYCVFRIILNDAAKGQLISKCLFGVFKFFQKNEQKQVVVKKLHPPCWSPLIFWNIHFGIYFKLG